MPNQDDVLAMGISQFHHPRSGSFDTVNGDHPWAYWCLAYTDSCMRNVGANVPLYGNAVTAGRARHLHGGRAPVGAAMFFDESFYWPDGHAMVSLGNGLGLTTLTDGKGVGIKAWNETSVGYMGWAFYDGIDGDPDDYDPRPQDPDPPPPSWYVQLDNPNNPDQDGNEVGIGGGFLRFYKNISIGQEPMTALGYALSNEQDAIVTDLDGTVNNRTIQRFERGTLIWQRENDFPWDVVVARLDAVITYQ